MRTTILAATITTLVLTCAGSALADDWTAIKLRGQVVQKVGESWQPIARGDVVSDSRFIRTTNGGRVTFARGNETIEIGPSTQIQIHDQGRTRPFTTVNQYYGEVAIEADVRQVEHFAVQTPYMVAVVKGTRFQVRSGGSDSSVTVLRGSVGVTAGGNGASTTIVAGQSASAGRELALRVKGGGEMPVVFDADGKPISVGPNGKVPGQGNGQGQSNGQGQGKP